MRQIGVPLPQPGPELESLLDVDGWLGPGDSPSAGAGRSIQAPAGEIGSAEVSLRTTPPRDLELPGQSGPVTHAVFTDGGRKIVTIGNNGWGVLWDAEHEWATKIAADRSLHGNDSEMFIWRLGRNQIRFPDSELKNWFLPDRASQGLLRRWDGPTGAVHNAVALADQRRVLMGDTDGIVRVWDVASGRELACLDGHTGAVHAVAVSADDRRVLAGYEDGTIRLWDLESARVITTLNGHTGAVEGLAFSPHGTIAASCGGSSDNAILIWDLTTARPLKRLKRDTPTPFYRWLSTRRPPGRVGGTPMARPGLGTRRRWTSRRESKVSPSCTTSVARS